MNRRKIAGAGMNKLKTILFALCAVLFLLTGLTGCGKNGRTGDQTPVVICTTYPVWLITRSLMQDAVRPPELQLLIPADTGCPHDFALSTAEMLNVSKMHKTLLVRNGGSLDARVFESLRSVNRDLIDCNATGLEFESGAEDEHAHEHAHDGEDPHLFTAPGSASVMVRRIAGALCKYDSANAAVYRKNSGRMLAGLEALSARWKDQRKGVSVILMHDSFRRFAEEGGMKVEGIIFDGHISELSPAEVKKITDTVKAKNVRLLIAEPQTPSKAAKLIAEETGIDVLMLDPAASGPMDVPIDQLERVIRVNIEAVCAGEVSK